MRKTALLAASFACFTSLAVMGCSSGKDGAMGKPGEPGEAGEPGVPGAAGPPGASAVVTPLPLGSSQCPFGGAEVSASGSIAYVCNGAPGSSVDGGSKSRGGGSEPPDGSDGASPGSPGPGEPGDASTPPDFVLRDATGVVLGHIVAIGDSSITIYTSNGYVAALGYDGTVRAAEIWYSGAGCAGTAYLNALDSTPHALFGKTVVRSASLNELMVPKNVGANGSAVSTGPFPVASIDNPTCKAATSGNGWELVATTAAKVGLPASIAVPLQLPE